jgi:hypothetical protein
VKVALLTAFAASKKEPLADMMNRVHQAIHDNGFGSPSIAFNFGDPLVPGFTSSVDRVLKRYPDLARFVTDAEPMPGIRGARRISNGPLSPAAGENLPYATLQAIASGVPRSFPFHSVVIHFFVDAFGTLEQTPVQAAGVLPGIVLSDSWWVNGRVRSLSACTVVDGDPAAKKLPELPEPLRAVLAACGKVKRTVQAPLAGAAEAAMGIRVRLPTGARVASANPEAARAVQAIVADYRARMGEVVERAEMPHDLGPHAEALLARAAALRSEGDATTAGPRKPALERAFKALGYSCKGGSGTFTLHRRTASNLTVELALDVGTWSHFCIAIFRVSGIGFKASLILPVSAKAAPGAQYPVADAEQWVQVVENLAALVTELDRTFVPDIERAAGPSPEWYRPG